MFGTETVSTRSRKSSVILVTKESFIERADSSLVVSLVSFVGETTGDESVERAHFGELVRVNRTPITKFGQGNFVSTGSHCWRSKFQNIENKRVTTVTKRNVRAS